MCVHQGDLRATKSPPLMCRRARTADPMIGSANFAWPSMPAPSAYFRTAAAPSMPKPVRKVSPRSAAYPPYRPRWAPTLMSAGADLRGNQLVATAAPKSAESPAHGGFEQSGRPDLNRTRTGQLGFIPSGYGLLRSAEIGSNCPRDVPRGMGAPPRPILRSCVFVLDPGSNPNERSLR
jgi:hypothetical protein